jgi:hypothetical protein
MHNLPDQGNPAYQGKKMATPGELHHLHNLHEEIPGEIRTSISRQHRPGNFQIRKVIRISKVIRLETGEEP